MKTISHDEIGGQPLSPDASPAPVGATDTKLPLLARLAIILSASVVLWVAIIGGVIIVLR
jgi:hypothetical protein